MARIVNRSLATRVWPLPDPNRTCGVVIALFRESGLAIIHPLEGDDAVAFSEDFLGDWRNLRQGQSVTFRLVDYGRGPIAEMLVNIHDPESEQALLNWQIANGF